MTETETPESLPTYDPYLGSNISLAVNDLAWLGNRFRGIMKVSESAKDILSLLRNEDELRARLTALEAREADLKVILAGTEAAQARLDNLTAEISTKLAAAEVEAHTAATGILVSAQEEAGHLLANARTAAEDVAHRQAEAHAEAVAQREAKIVELDGVIEARESTAAALDTRINSANRALAALRSKLS